MLLHAIFFSVFIQSPLQIPHTVNIEWRERGRARTHKTKHQHKVEASKNQFESCRYCCYCCCLISKTHSFEPCAFTLTTAQAAA